MTSELVERLRAQRPNGEPISVARLMDEAADEIERLTAQLAEARQAERAAVSEVNACKDALAQTAEFICRKCGRRQDGPSDNEARF